MGEHQENNKIGGGGGDNAMAVATAAAKGKSLGAADPRLQGISDAIRVVPHFPKPGIMFNDITELLLRPAVFKDAVDMFVERYRGMDIAAVAGIEARGFIFGPAIALAIGAKFIPLRKPKKLPGEVFSESYVLEYGMDCLEMHVGATEPGERVVVVDDLVATGGTLSAAIRLLGFVQAQRETGLHPGGVPQIGRCKWSGMQKCFLSSPPKKLTTSFVCTRKQCGMDTENSGQGLYMYLHGECEMD